MSNCGCEIEIQDRSQSRVLIILLVINALMFVIEITLGWWAQSTALIADALDMLADAMVYAVALYAVGRAAVHKLNAARISGMLQISLGILVLTDVLRRFIYGSEPQSTMMMAIGLVALVANVTCLVLIAKHRQGEIHMRASWIFSKNDVIANVGVIVAGLLVMLSGSRLPDLIIGLIIASVVCYGGVQIINDVRNTSK